MASIAKQPSFQEIKSAKKKLKRPASSNEASNRII
eukprot:CAMPEP_0168328786 /NCGR_PEP_ID=MMETSP0213-20121227/6715_1 /TAXON_ID=151035 /ORGANISM="Euplotes harpa, Strain FSP1.4" /LENGTH=34 /DNA_ID= /DNA_START= /DNA_END= /DNA_ORIENTATION=